ncbi:unnamed protein product [Lactuca saligna]|uniref:TIR domain-containing protein n=1 Tax=Lactuca saligna TaxID=75948 RepID=A0AA35ZSU1_LACSI|nr:unnamed protein product [Lactuca saligna]
MASSSSPSAPTFSYHVFINFRGEDTRNNFVGHLYSDFEQKGIHTYKDDEKLPRGASIGPALIKAIEASQVAVIVFSENYADSSWCLDELVHIMECKDKRHKIVVPIFYGVKPSESRKQKRKYGEAFAKHELENKKKLKSWGQSFLENSFGWLFAPLELNRKYTEETVNHELENQTNVESWKNVVVDASNIAGWEFNDNANTNESTFIKRIVENISLMLHPITPKVNNNLVGIVARMQDFKSKLQIRSCGVLMIGIWGGGGGGKILSDVLKPNQEQVGGVKEGKHMIKDRLCHRKVLIVLDDVDHLEQLEALAGSHDWFGEGSLVIITTRDEHLLNVHKVDLIHKVSLLNKDESMELFCKHAPRGDRRIEDCEVLSNAVVSYAGGLPLALRVLSCFLCDKDMNQWRSAIARLKEIPETGILGKLKVSFDGLELFEQDLFLDIACFFRWEKKATAMEILDACGFHPVIGIEVLRQKALITISEDGRFDMHDLVQEMGHYIVRGEHPNNPEKYSRICKNEDVFRICAMDAMMVSDKIEAIKMDFWIQRVEEQEQNLHSVAAYMKNLRYMDWRYEPAKLLFNDLPLRALCCLILCEGLQKQLWEGCKSLQEIDPSIGYLKKLVCLSIEGCPSLEMFPPIWGIEKLETLSFAKHHEFLGFPEIQQQKMENSPHLDLDNSGNEVSSNIESYSNYFVICWRCGCSNLPGVECCVQEPGLCGNITLGFFHNLQELRLLRKLDLSMCHLGDEDIGSDVLEFPNLQQLSLSENKFSRLYFSQLRLPRLKWLDVSWCVGLVEVSDLPSSIAVVIADGCRSLESLGDISSCKWLWKLSLNGKNEIDPLVGEILLDSMFQIPKGFVGSPFKGKTFTKRLPHVKWGNLLPPDFLTDDGKIDLHRLADVKYDAYVFRRRLPNDWCDDYCGFLMRIVTKGTEMCIDINMKQEPDQEDSRFEIWQESNEAPEPEYDGALMTHVGYVSFSSLRRNTSLNSSYNIISFSLEDMDWISFAAELIPRKSKDHPLQTTNVATDSSEFWGEENDDDDDDDDKAFKFQDDSKSCINILWRYIIDENSVNTLLF